MKVKISGNETKPTKKEPIIFPEISNRKIELPTEIITERMVLDIKTKIIELLMMDEISYNILDNEKIIRDFNIYMSPILNKLLLSTLSPNVTTVNKTDACNIITEIIFYYIKFEYYTHSLVIKDDFIRDCISNIVFAVVFKDGK